MSESPFAVLEIAPTRDLGAVKRAYFALLAKHPPHADPAGFRRLRQAYEQLTRPDGLALALARSPIDVQAELAAWQARFNPTLGRVAAELRERDAREAAVRRFIERAGALTYAEALALAEKGQRREGP
jgi:curved DNA-binding protein CbpA